LLVIQGIEATQMIRKGQVLGITRHNLHGPGFLVPCLASRKLNLIDFLLSALTRPTMQHFQLN
jgi:hypothetical protein